MRSAAGSRATSRTCTRGSARAARTTEHTVRPRALVLQHGHLGPPGVLGTWLHQRGIDAVIHRVAEGAEIPGPDGFGFVASLGSAKSPRERHDQLVAQELDYIEACVDRDVPVLGLCFGGQALSLVLGGSVEVLGAPELGWHTIETDAPDLVAPGPWLQWHFEAFTTPSGAEELARSPACAQAFRQGPHVAVQFHPESTAEIVSEWARHDHETGRLAGALDDHLAALQATARTDGAAAERAAMRLFDGFWAECLAAGASRR